MEPKKIKYPRIWQNKRSKQKLRVMPWWEMLDKDVMVARGDFVDDIQLSKLNIPIEREFKIGVLVQIGYLLENEHGVWFGLGLKAKKEFKDLGYTEIKKTSKEHA